MNALTATTRLVRPLRSRDPDQDHRTSSPLELLTDLCFVVAVAQAALVLHHGLVEDAVGHAVVGYLMAFFAIWWAWINFTWFGSAYDNDDALYRGLTILQIVGVLVLASGVHGLPEGHVTTVVLGYVIMRVALVLQWLRAAKGDPAHRATCLRYAVGIVLVQLGWVSYIWIAHTEGLRLPLFVLFALLDLAVPWLAERPGPATTWNPGHIADRYGLFYIIVLGELIYSGQAAFQAAFSGETANRGHLVMVVLSGVLIIFGVWWLYFSREAGELLERAKAENTNVQYVWGFGHYLIFASAAAVGAGLAARVEYWSHPEEVSALVTAFGITVPVAALLAALWLVHLRGHDPSARTAAPFGAAVLLILAGTFTPFAELTTGLIVLVLLAVEVNLARAKPAAPLV